MILPAVVAIASILKPILFTTVTGAAISGAADTVVSTVSDYQEHGEVTVEMVVENVRAAGPAVRDGLAIGAVVPVALKAAAPVANAAGSVATNGIARVAPGAADDIGRFVSTAWDDIGRFARNTADDFGNTLGQVGDDFGKRVSSVREGISSAVDDAGNTLEQVGDDIGKRVSSVREGISSAVDDAGNTLGQVGDDIGKRVSSVREGISSAVDDAGNTLGQVGDDIGKRVSSVREGISSAVNDVGSTLGQVGDDIGKKVNKVTSSASSASNYRRNLDNARIFDDLQVTPGKHSYVYVIDDAAAGSTKIGISGNLPQRIKQLESTVGRELNYVCIIPTVTARALEADLHTIFAGQRLPNTGAGTEWFQLSPAQVRQACSR